MRVDLIELVEDLKDERLRYPRKKDFGFQLPSDSNFSTNSSACFQPAHLP